jgi:putative ABC transport system permease protein
MVSASAVAGQFLRPVLIANLVAWPLAFIAMRTWLAGFDDRISLSPIRGRRAQRLADTDLLHAPLGVERRKTPQPDAPDQVIHKR